VVKIWEGKASLRKGGVKKRKQTSTRDENRAGKKKYSLLLKKGTSPHDDGKGKRGFLRRERKRGNGSREVEKGVPISLGGEGFLSFSWFGGGGKTWEGREEPALLPEVGRKEVQCKKKKGRSSATPEKEKKSPFSSLKKERKQSCEEGKYKQGKSIGDPLKKRRKGEIKSFRRSHRR